jgi:chromate transporter
LAAQLGIYIGFVHYKVVGATLVGLAFVLPSFIMVVLLGIAYKLYGLPLMQSIFYGVGAAVVGIIFISTYKLTIKSIVKFLQSFKEKWMLWIFFTTAMILTYITENENVFLFIAAGILYMLFKSPPKISFRKGANSVILLQMGLSDWDNPILLKLPFFSESRRFCFW